MNEQPKRIQLRRTKGWREPEGAVVVARSRKFGNPYSISQGERGLATASRQIVVDRYRDWMTHHHGTTRQGGTGALVCWCLRYGDRDAVLAALSTLAGRDLACWCPLDQPCHADVLLDLANRPGTS